MGFFSRLFGSAPVPTHDDNIEAYILNNKPVTTPGGKGNTTYRFADYASYWPAQPDVISTAWENANRPEKDADDRVLTDRGTPRDLVEGVNLVFGPKPDPATVPAVDPTPEPTTTQTPVLPGALPVENWTVDQLFSYFLQYPDRGRFAILHAVASGPFRSIFRAQFGDKVRSVVFGDNQQAYAEWINAQSYGLGSQTNFDLDTGEVFYYAADGETRVVIGV